MPRQTDRNRQRAAKSPKSAERRYYDELQVRDFVFDPWLSSSALLQTPASIRRSQARKTTNSIIKGRLLRRHPLGLCLAVIAAASVIAIGSSSLSPNEHKHEQHLGSLVTASGTNSGKHAAAEHIIPGDLWRSASTGSPSDSNNYPKRLEASNQTQQAPRDDYNTPFDDIKSFISPQTEQSKESSARQQTYTTRKNCSESEDSSATTLAKDTNRDDRYDPSLKGRCKPMPVASHQPTLAFTTAQTKTPTATGLLPVLPVAGLPARLPDAAVNAANRLPQAADQQVSASSQVSAIDSKAVLPLFGLAIASQQVPLASSVSASRQLLAGAPRGQQTAVQLHVADDSKTLEDPLMVAASKKKKKKKMKKEKKKKKSWKKKKMKKKKKYEEKKKKGMKKKKASGMKKKKKFGEEKKSHKKSGKFKKKKWGSKKKKKKGVKKGEKGHKFLKDKGFKKTGFKKVHHKEEYGKKKKWHDIKRKKQWNSKKKKWKKKWKEEKGKKYKGKHEKKYKKQKKHGKKYKKEKKEKFKKEKKEKFKKGHKKKMEKMSKKKASGMKKMKKMEKKKKKSG